MKGFLVGRRALAVLVALTAVMVFGVPNAFATLHGVAQAKTCTSPTKIGQAYVCSAQVSNIIDEGHDTIEVTDLNDTVNSAGGTVPSGSIFGTVGLIFSGSGTVTCVGGSGAGTAGSPYVGATDCQLTFGAVITTTNFTHYTVQAGDFNILTATQLSVASAVGDTNVKLASTSLAVGDSFTIDPGQPDQETRVATVVGSPGALGTGVSFSTPLAFPHAVSTP